MDNSSVAYELITNQVFMETCYKTENLSSNDVSNIFTVLENLPNVNRYIFHLFKNSIYGNNICSIGEFKYKKNKFNKSYFSNIREITFQISKYDKYTYSIKKLFDNYYLVGLHNRDLKDTYIKCDDVYGFSEWISDSFVS